MFDGAAEVTRDDSQPLDLQSLGCPSLFSHSLRAVKLAQTSFKGFDL